MPSLSEEREVRGGGGKDWGVYSSECLVGVVRFGSLDPDPISDQNIYFCGTCICYPFSSLRRYQLGEKFRT